MNRLFAESKEFDGKPEDIIFSCIETEKAFVSYFQVPGPHKLHAIETSFDESYQTIRVKGLPEKGPLMPRLTAYKGDLSILFEDIAPPKNPKDKEE